MSTGDPASSAGITLTISFRGTAHSITILLSSSVLSLHEQLEDITNVPPSLQKLLYKGKKLTWTSEEDAQRMTVEQVGLKDGMKVQFLGTTLKEVEGLKKEEGEHLKKAKILRERALKAPIKVRSTGSSATSSSSPPLRYRFHAIQPLSDLPQPALALSLLQKLASDPAISHIMQKHQFSVGLLTELAPHEHPHLLGLNENKGMTILLRLRTKEYDGFRPYKEVRRVLCHELAHNVWSDHEQNFKELNSKLNREMEEYERSVALGTHYLDNGQSRNIYQPEQETEAQTYVLGGGGSSGTNLSAESHEERRRRILEATMNRLRKDEEIEQSCGTSKGASTTE